MQTCKTDSFCKLWFSVSDYMFDVDAKIWQKFTTCKANTLKIEDVANIGKNFIFCKIFSWTFNSGINLISVGMCFTLFWHLWWEGRGRGWICSLFLFVKTIEKELRICVPLLFYFLSCSFKDMTIFQEFQLSSDGRGILCP